MDEWLKQLGNLFTNISMSAANADAPAITTASGWNRNEDGSWNQSKIDNPGVQQLRDNLSTISGMAFGAEMEPLVTSGWQILRHPVQTGKTVYNFSRKLINKTQNTDYLNRLIKLLGDKKDKNIFDGNRTQITKPFADYLENLGIDTSNLTNLDLTNLMQMRNRSVRYSLPQERTGLIYEMKTNTNRTKPSIEINEGDLNIGDIDLKTSLKDPYLHVDMIQRDASNSKGFSEDAYNAALEYINQTKTGKGLISGERLLSPEITYKVWNHYPNRRLLNNSGWHTFDNGRDIITNTSIPKDINNGPVVLLTTPSTTPIPLKHANIFHPSMITKEGVLKSPDWTKKSIYKAVIPTTIAGTTYGNSKD